MRSRAVDAARGHHPLDLLICNTRLVNVFTREIYPADIGICEGVIVSVEPPGKIHQSAGQIFQAGSKYAVPGLVDTHVHIESSMMTPAGFVEAVLPLGTTTIVADPHEIGNVLGLRGVRYMLEATASLPMRIYFQAPSCVPSVPGIETAGDDFGGDEIRSMLGWERVIGLAEVMDYIGVIQQAERMQQVVGAARDAELVISGHCPGLRGQELSAYLVAGPSSDHEGFDPDELGEKLRKGMYVEGRVSSFSQSLSSLAKIFTRFGNLPPNLVMCTDDIYPDDLLRHGHMDEVVRKGVSAGIPAVDMIRAASWNGAQRHRLHHLGAIAPGMWADLILAGDLEDFQADEVFCRGSHVASRGKMLAPMLQESFPLEYENTVHLLDQPSSGDFRIKAREGRREEQVRIMVIAQDLRRSLEVRTYPVSDGIVDFSADPETCLATILERHGRNGNVSQALVKGLGLHEGAAATTVSHDCHNLLVIGRDPSDMVLAAQVLADCGGGICSVSAGQVQALLPLPVGGLMSRERANQVAAQLERLNHALTAQGIRQEKPLTGLLSLALPVIPDYGLTDLGLVDVSTQALLGTIVE